MDLPPPPFSPQSNKDQIRVPGWLLDELRRLLQAASSASDAATQAQARALFPIHLLCCKSPAPLLLNCTVVAFAFLPNAANDTGVVRALEPETLMKHCIAPCGLLGVSVKVLSDPAELLAFLSSAAVRPVEGPVLQAVEAATALAVLSSPKLPTSSNTASGPPARDFALMTTVQDENFTLLGSRCDPVVAPASAAAAASAEEIPLSRRAQLLLKEHVSRFRVGGALLLTSTVVSLGDLLPAPSLHQTSQAVFFCPALSSSSSKDSAVGVLEACMEEEQQLAASFQHQSAVCDHVKNDGSGRVHWKCFHPQLEGAWCPLLVPSSPPAVRAAFHRALLLPPAPHLRPGRCLVSRLQSRLQQHADAQRREEQRDQRQGRTAAATSSLQPTSAASASVNSPVLAALRTARSMSKPKHSLLIDPHRGLVKKRWDGILQQQKNYLSSKEDGASLGSSSSSSLSAAGLFTVRGSLLYFHYCVDGFDDKGWGCAYRSAQTLVSWFSLQCDFGSGGAEQQQQQASSSSAVATVPEPIEVPEIPEIQKVLAAVDLDKKPSFVGSKTWIGSYEVMLLLQFLMPALECKIIRVEKGADFYTDPDVLRQLVGHFERSGAAPVMIGGANYAHTILGVEVLPVNSGGAAIAVPPFQILILDPHYVSASKMEPSLDTVLAKGWCGWKKPHEFFVKDEWYNLLLPQALSLL